MSILTIIARGIGAVVLIMGSTLVAIATLPTPKEYRGDGKVPKDDTWDESIEDV